MLATPCWFSNLAVVGGGCLLYSRMLHIQVSFVLGSQTAYEMPLSNGVYQLTRKTTLDSWAGSVEAVTY